MSLIYTAMVVMRVWGCQLAYSGICGNRFFHLRFAELAYDKVPPVIQKMNGQGCSFFEENSLILSTVLP